MRQTHFHHCKSLTIQTLLWSLEFFILNKSWTWHDTIHCGIETFPVTYPSLCDWQILFVSFQCLVLGVKDNIWEQSNYSTGKAKYIWSCISWAVWTPWWDLGAKPQETKPMAMMEATEHSYIVHSCTLELVSIPNMGVITTPLSCSVHVNIIWSEKLSAANKQR